MTQELFTQFAVFIALFLFGMTVMRTGLSNVAQDKLKNMLASVTDTPLKGVVLGTFITAILQSSSAVMILTVGLVAAGYISFNHSIGIILGTNIGTCITLEILTFDLSTAVFPLLFLGILFIFIPKQLTYCLGCISFGLACIFIAMGGLETLAYPLSTLPFSHEFFTKTNENQLLGLGIGTALSALIQSSTATTAITMGFMNEELISLPSGIAIMLGANIGTCFTAFLASIGSGQTARLVAYAHIWLNILGALFFFPLIGWLSELSIMLTSSPTVQLAHASLIFNLLSSIIVLPFIKYFSRFVVLLHGK